MYMYIHIHKYIHIYVFIQICIYIYLFIYAYISSFFCMFPQVSRPRDMEKLVKGAPAEALDMMKKLLAFNPSKRPTVQVRM